MSIAFVAATNTLPIDGFTINGFGITGFRTFVAVPADAALFAAIGKITPETDDDCCTGVMVPPAKAPLRTPWGTRQW
jgi:hypothetical protein